MNIFSVYLDQDLDIEKAKIVSHSFSFTAFLFSYLWSIYHRLGIFTGLILLLDALTLSAFSSDLINFWQFSCAKISIMLYVGISANLWRQMKYSKHMLQETILACDKLAAQKIMFENFMFSENFKNK